MKKKPERSVNYVLIPYQVYNAEDITAEEKLLLGEIELNCNSETGSPCWGGNTYLARNTKTTKNVVANRISKLVRLGYLIKAISEADEDGMKQRYLWLNPKKTAFTVQLSTVNHTVIDPSLGDETYNTKENKTNKPSVNTENTSALEDKELERDCFAPILTDEKPSDCTTKPLTPDPTPKDPEPDQAKAKYKYDPSLPKNGGLLWKDVVKGVKDTWEAKAKGEMVVTHVVKSLKTLVKWHGSVKVLGNWGRYVDQTKPEFLSWGSFRSKFGQYDEVVKKVNKRLITSIDQIQG